jgi:NifU-like protein
LGLDVASNTVERVNYRTNGCGFMAAAAEVISAELSGKDIRKLHSLDEKWLTGVVGESLGLFEEGRDHCRSACIEAIRFAFEELRFRRLAESPGESPLICTCFGVDEETIVNLISGSDEASVDDVGQKINAGRGCGSCRMMIQELIDALSISHAADLQK